MAEVEVDGLNENTFARYGLRPSDYEAWSQLR